jgi:hypothetical protein
VGKKRDREARPEKMTMITSSYEFARPKFRLKNNNPDHSEKEKEDSKKRKR